MQNFSNCQNLWKGLFYFFVSAGALPKFSMEDITKLKAADKFKPHFSFQKHLENTKQGAVLFTASIKETAGMQSEYPALIEMTGKTAETRDQELLPFSAAAKKLKSGDDKRILQLAVQYLAAGGVDDSLIAAEYDWDFLQKIREDLTKQ